MWLFALVAGSSKIQPFVHTEDARQPSSPESTRAFLPVAETGSAKRSSDCCTCSAARCSGQGVIIRSSPACGCPNTILTAREWPCLVSHWHGCGLWPSLPIQKVRHVAIVEPRGFRQRSMSPGIPCVPIQHANSVTPTYHKRAPISGCSFWRMVFHVRHRTC